MQTCSPIMEVHVDVIEKGVSTMDMNISGLHADFAVKQLGAIKTLF